MRVYRVRLARREREIADLVGDLLTYGEIAGRLGIEYETVRSCVNRIANKLPDDGRRAQRRVMLWVRSERERLASSAA